VVVATNVAETSITIDGVRLVIDSGLARIPRYDANRGINTLLIEKICAPTSAASRVNGPMRNRRFWTATRSSARPAEVRRRLWH